MTNCMFGPFTSSKMSSLPAPLRTDHWEYLLVGLHPSKDVQHATMPAAPAAGAKQVASLCRGNA